MKKTTLVFALFFTFLTANMFGQARNELNFGLIGVNYEIPVSNDVSIAPGASTNFGLDWITLHVKANYYFDRVFGIEDNAWDVYGGIGAGFAIYNGDNEKNDDFDMGLHVGGRWFWNDKWGLYVEFGGGSTQGATGGLGVTLKL